MSHPDDIGTTLRLLFGLSLRVPRRAYILWGFLLAALKIGLDNAIVYAFTGRLWSPLGYVLPGVLFRQDDIGSVPEAMHVALIAVAMPFLWVGVTMSVRRAADAGASPWLGVGFLIPIVKYIVIAVLCFLPSKANAAWDSPREGAGDDALASGTRDGLLGVAAAAALGAGMVALSVQALSTYGAALFYLTPFVMGAVAGGIYNARGTRGLGRTIWLALVSTVITGLVLLFSAQEGVLCLVMAFPLAMVVALVGAVVARAIVAGSRSHRGTTLVILLPIFAVGEAHVVRPQPREVTTVIEVDAPPERVWPNVIGFSELPPPHEWVFRAGVAYPVRARIDGAGVGAVRHCEFSTGAFVEPITVWEPPRRLAFDVTAQPPSMIELSPFGAVHAPHLEGYFAAQGGEFRLVALPGGRTRIEGTTHYTLSFFPEVYWVGYAEALLHAIHGRVLSHIKTLSERGAAGQ